MVDDGNDDRRRHPNGWTFETLRAHLSSMVEANDRRYEQRFKDSQTAVDAALNAARTAVDAALSAAKEAVHKAEIASEKRFEGARIESDLRLNELAKQISGLKDSDSEMGGRRLGAQAMWGYIIGGLGILFAVLARVLP